MAKSFDKLGMQSFAYGCYDHGYKSSKKIDNQHFMFEKSVNYGYTKQVLYYGERMLSNADFEAFCIETSASNFDKAERFCADNSVVGNSKTKLLLSVMNEENYVKNQYVKALIKAGRLDDAFSFAMNDIKEESSKSIVTSDATFSLASVVNAGKKLATNEIEIVRDYYEKLVTYVDALQLDGNDRITEYKDMLIAQRVCEIASTLELLYTNIDLTPEVDLMKQAFNHYRGLIYG